MLTWISSKQVDTQDKNQQEQDNKSIKTVQALDDTNQTHITMEVMNNNLIHGYISKNQQEQYNKGT